MAEEGGHLCNISEKRGKHTHIYLSHLHPQKPCAVEDILSFDEAY